MRPSAEAAIATSQVNQTELHFLIQRNADGILVLDEGGTVLFANPAAVDIFGRGADRLVGHALGMPLVAGETTEIEVLQPNGKSVSVELRVVETVWGGHDCLLVSLRDISERRRLEDQLRQSQKLEAVGSLTAGVAHDFNNLLSPIIGSLDLIQRKGVIDERAAKLLDGALRSAERAKTLVQRLLAFARRQPLQPVPVDLARLVESMADLIASTSGPKVRIKVELPADLPAVQADPNQIEMALLNLSVNARDAMPDGGELTIAVTTREVDEGHRSQLAPGRYVCLSVSDTGVGMDEATLARAVEPFFSTKGIGRGTGLGLSMVHGLAGQLGGALTIRSEPGTGTSVEFWLPLATGSAAAAVEPAADAKPDCAGTALLVDDEELVRASTAAMLAELGYLVIEVDSAEEALRRAESGLAFDLLVTDHLMPGMSGVELVHEVRRRAPNTPVLIISGYAEVAGISPDLPRLVKPFRQNELASSLAGLPSPGGYRQPG